MEPLRKPFQGVYNIVRFNWHFYVLFLFVVTGGFLLGTLLDAKLYFYVVLACLLAILVTISSLVISYLIYDKSALYTLNWLDQYSINTGYILNIHSGFDETSVLLGKKYPGSRLKVFDFYDPDKHTEVSIKRARKATQPYPGTLNISSNELPLHDSTADCVFLIFAAHEIRKD